MTHKRPGRKEHARRQEAAAARKAERIKRTKEAQRALLDNRPGESRRERARLQEG